MNLLALEGDCALQMMARYGLVKRDGFGAGSAFLLRLIRADEEDTRPAAILGRRVVLVGPAFLAELRVRLDDDVGFRQEAEPFRRGRFRACERCLRVGDQLSA